MKESFSGTGVALVTPFNSDLTVDYQGLQKLIKHTLPFVDYYVVQGTTGESATTTDEEKDKILRFVIEQNQGKLPIVYGIGGNNTNYCLAEIEKANYESVKAILSVSPYYNKPSQEGIFQHYTALADACPVPVILYNVPGRTGSNIEAETCLRLAEHQNIVGIKDASCNFQQLIQIAKFKPDNFCLISGDDLCTVPLISIGGCGVISVTANAFPDVYKLMVDSALNNDFLRAQQALFKLLEITPLMFEEGNPVGIKELLYQMSVCDPYVRMPLTTASSNLKRRIKQHLSEIMSTS
jgi:4-hydroxy-tetrahydrodipicolinate synthase